MSDARIARLTRSVATFEWRLIGIGTKNADISKQLEQLNSESIQTIIRLVKISS